MMSDAVIAAVGTLQKRAMTTTDGYALDRIERALDELLRNPADDTVPAKHRIRSALGHAHETLERRKQIAPQTELRTGNAEPGYLEQGYQQVEMLAWICTEPKFGEADRAILVELALGADAESLAEQYCVPVPRMRERISRCRRSARQLWADLDLAA